MTSWNALHAAAPDLAERARDIILCTTNAVLATLHRDGSPRLSGIDPFFFEEEFWFGSMPSARKGDDLRRDPRMAIHSIPWESRQVKAEDPGDVDAKVSGRAISITDPAEVARVMAWFKDERGLEPPDGADLFRVDLRAVVTIEVEGDNLVIDQWTASAGRQTIKRT